MCGPGVYLVTASLIRSLLVPGLSSSSLPPIRNPSWNDLIRPTCDGKGAYGDRDQFKLGLRGSGMWP